jgi:hypothetical protein
MEVLISETLKKIISKAMENITGLTVEFLKDPGSTIRWKVKEFSHGQTAGDTKEIIKMIRKKATVFSTGQMEENMTEVGKMESNTAWVLTPQPVVNQSKESGKKAKGFIGFPATVLNNDFK